MSLKLNYAQALYDVAAKERALGLVAGDLAKVSPFFEKKSPALKLFTSPVLSGEERLAALEEIKKSLNISPLVSRFLNLIVKKGRAQIFSQIVEEFEAIFTRANGGVLGVVWSSTSITEAEIKEIEKSFEKKLGKKVSLKTKEDTSLIAGVRVVVDGVTYDRSVRSQLDRIRMSFLENHN